MYAFIGFGLIIIPATFGALMALWDIRHTANNR